MVLSEDRETVEVTCSENPDFPIILSVTDTQILAVVVLFKAADLWYGIEDKLHKTSELAQRALQHALDARQPDEGLLVHSDRGKEYYAGEYQHLI